MGKIVIKKLTTLEDLRQLISVFSVAFNSEYIVDDEYLNNMLSNQLLLVLGVCKENSIVGGLVAFEMRPIHGSKELYIYDIAVHPEHQKQGLGKKMIEYLKEEAKNRGVQTIFVEAESEDEGAVAFYRTLGGEELSVNHYNFAV